MAEKQTDPVPEMVADGGCLAFAIAIIIGIGAGTIWGEGYGWITAGVTMAILYIVSLVLLIINRKIK